MRDLGLSSFVKFSNNIRSLQQLKHVLSCVDGTLLHLLDFSSRNRDSTVNVSNCSLKFNTEKCTYHKSLAYWISQTTCTHGTSSQIKKLSKVSAPAAHQVTMFIYAGTCLYYVSKLIVHVVIIAVRCISINIFQIHLYVPTCIIVKGFTPKFSPEFPSSLHPYFKDRSMETNRRSLTSRIAKIKCTDYPAHS